jgi:hypothetical protein|uniref:Uncharacterized protein n=1 Tax=Rhodopseudomonas palustris (strain DX-1) TaxID=652103 RepID=E6VKR2_RHOPX
MHNYHQTAAATVNRWLVEWQAFETKVERISTKHGA